MKNTTHTTRAFLYSSTLSLTTLLLATSTGCNSNATTAALGTALGIGAATPLATHSQIDVKVDVFNEDGYLDSYGNTYFLPKSTTGYFNDLDSKVAQQVIDCRRARKPRQSALEAAAQLDTESETLAADDQTPLKNLANDLRTYAAQPTSMPATLWVNAGKVAKIAQKNPDNPSLQDAASSAISIISSGASTGPLSDEVSQMVLAKSAPIDIITNVRNERNWRPFAQASSSGGTGDHSAVIYFENMGFPVLKSSHFDPTKFIEAFGKTYQVAFAAIAKAYGVPTSTTGKDATSGLDPISSDFRRQTQEKRTADIRKELLKVLDEVIADQNAIAKDATKINAQGVTDLQAKLTALSTELKDLEAAQSAPTQTAGAN